MKITVFRRSQGRSGLWRDIFVQLTTMKPILVLDNYDSFTYNLVHLLEALSDAPLEVKRNDLIDLADVDRYDRILLSPGPGVPEEAGSLIELIRVAPAHMPILGICLGMQALAVASGGKMFQLPTVKHGIATPIRLNPEQDRLALYQQLPTEFEVGRYHSWMVDEETLPADWMITARDEAGGIMSMTHRLLPRQGVQFHPESVMTPLGRSILQNWLLNC